MGAALINSCRDVDYRSMSRQCSQRHSAAVPCSAERRGSPQPCERGVGHSALFFEYKTRDNYALWWRIAEELDEAK